MKALSKYIPTEIVTLYIATVAAREALVTVVPAATGQAVFWLFVFLTPVMFLLVFAHTLARTRKKVPHWRDWPWFKVIASTIAFGVWALAVPSNPYVHGVGAAAVAGLAALFVSTVLDLVAPLFETS